MLQFNQRGIAPLLIIGITFLALVLGVWLVQNRTNIIPSAQEMSAPRTAFLLTPGDMQRVADELTYEESVYGPVIKPGDKFTVDVRVASEIEEANAFSAVINFPPDLLEVVEIIKTPAYFESSDSASYIPTCKGDDQCGPDEFCDRSGCSDGICPEEGYCISKGYMSKRGLPCQDDSQCAFTEYCDQGAGSCLNLKSEWGEFSVDFAETAVSDDQSSSEVCAQVITKACKTEYVACDGGSCPSEEICKDFASPCEVPDGWYVPFDESQLSFDSGCKVDPENPSECLYEEALPYVSDYFIEHWLPDTKFDNEKGTLFLSGGVSQAIKTDSFSNPIMGSVVFRAKKAGVAKLFFNDQSAILRASDAQNNLTFKEGLDVTIKDSSAIKGDIDGDGIVNMKDFSNMLSKWGSDDKGADINGNDKVDIFDFSLLVSNWSKP